MAEATFLIPEKDAERARALETHPRDIVGVNAVQVAPKPFDPFGPDAETQAVAESCVTVSYDPAETTVEQIQDALKTLDIHVLDARANG